MCGICGVYKFRGTADDALPLVKGAIETLSKRGPEVQATYCNRNVVLGHSRLSIIDTTDAANQPFSDQTGRYTLVFNGEIYNFRQLRSQLVANGVTFRTQSDTEVLLHWLIQKGPQGMQSLQGFFAFALYDQLDGSFLLARDRFGIKPLLYHHEKETLCFASEMKALVKLGIPKVIDRESLQMYFQLNYIPAPWSIYEGVEKLMPGHYLTIRSGKIQTHQYYDIPAAPLHAIPRPDL
jgi:asparagine synthase (glutamine-hydrolysing)